MASDRVVVADVNRLFLRIWAAITITLAMSAAILILARNIGYATSAVGLAMLIMVMVAALGAWGLAVYFIFRPGYRVLQSPFFKGGVTLIVTAGVGGGLIHYLRFIPSPEAAPTLSKVIATLLMAAGISAYVLLMWLIWYHIKRGKGA
jgi:hypothetical protein